MQYTVSALLPFPLRLTGGPYSILTEVGYVSLTLERVERLQFDERIVSRGERIDFSEDRHGLASYSRVVGTVELSSQQHAVSAYLSGINRVIQHLRDLLSLHWLHELEVADLFQLTVEDGLHGVRYDNFGRVGGVHLAITNISDAARKRLEVRLRSSESVAEWRLLQLDAQDALATGRYDQAVILGWTALEAACRSEIPRLAKEAGLDITDTWKKLNKTDREPKQVSFSYEQVVEEAKVMSCIEACCSLVETGYDELSLAQSARSAYKLRNVVAHRGLRLGPSEAKKALDAVSFVLRVLGLPTTLDRSQSPNLQEWERHFGAVTPVFRDEMGRHKGRVALCRQSGGKDIMSSWFQLEIIDDLWVVSIPDGIPESVAATLTVVTADSFHYGHGTHPRLVADDAVRDMFISGILDTETVAVTQSVHFAHAALRRKEQGFPVEASCNYAISSIREGLSRLKHTFTEPDVRFNTVPARIASYYVHAAQSIRNDFDVQLAAQHGQLVQRVREWSGHLMVLRSDDPHTICDALRAIHKDAVWLDTVRVDCPIERVQYGVGKRPRS